MTRATTAAPRKDEKTGTWGFIVDVVGADEKRHQTRRRGFKTLAEAQAILDEVRTAVRKDAYIPPSTVTLREFVEKTWLPAVRVKLEESTLASYRRNLDQHVLPRLGHLRLTAVTPEALNILYADLQASGRRDGRGGLSDRTVRYIATIIGKVFDDAMRWDKILRNPARRADPPSARGAQSKRPDPWTARELQAFLQRCGESRYRPLYTFLALTGCRRGEAVGLHWSDVDLDGSLARIRTTITAIEHKVKINGKTKSGREREVELDAPTVTTLRTWRARQAQERLLFGTGYQNCDLVFCHADGRPYHPERVSREFDRMIERQRARRVRLHDLRHGWATMALKAGVHPKVVQERLGHANVGITLNIYSHTDPELRSGAAAKVASLVFGA
jgi:integrase